jgi:hypothetical protein
MAIESIPSEWALPREFLTPAILNSYMEGFALRPAELQDRAGPDEILLAGRGNQYVVVIAIDTRADLPKMLHKCLPGPTPTGQGLDCIEESRFQWNIPISPELFVPDSPAVRRLVH